MHKVKKKEPEQYYLSALRAAKSRNPDEFYQLCALKNLYNARMNFLVAGNYEASQFVQNAIDILRYGGVISEKDY